jgi:hypothetical protein
MLEVMVMQRNLPWALFPLLLMSSLLISSAAFAQNDAPMDPSRHVRFRVLYDFKGAEDGAFLYGGLARDREGSLFGVTFVNGGAKGAGALFKLEREHTGYKLKVLHDFVDDPAGECMTTPTFDQEGNLFGVCTNINGTLWEYSRDGEFSVLHKFYGSTDGMRPVDAVAVDNAGNIYGTAYTYGPGIGGTLWEYSRSQRTFTVLHAFANRNDGNLLPAGPTLDENGKLWGTTQYGPNCWYCGSGTVWSYDLASGTSTTVVDFGASGAAAPQSHLTLDSEGNFYGAGSGTTVGNCGLVFELEKNNNYAPVILYSFAATTGQNADGCSPGNVALDQHGNVLGATCAGGASGWGTVYQLSREHGWEETILHSFNYKDGYCPQALTEGDGRWFGTTTFGGTLGEGTIFEISGEK